MFKLVIISNRAKSPVVIFVMSSPKFERRMYFEAPALIHKHAKRLRKNQTQAEEILWEQLKKSPWGYKFRRQHPISTFVADFYCHRAKLIIEVDGKVHEEESTKRNDKEREWNLELMGLIILRFKNEDVFKKLSFVMESIKSHLVK
jgi:imidazole glycerol-phosphate synthase subunit HisF